MSTQWAAVSSTVGATTAAVHWLPEVAPGASARRKATAGSPGSVWPPMTGEELEMPTCSLGEEELQPRATPTKAIWMANDKVERFIRAPPDGRGRTLQGVSASQTSADRSLGCGGLTVSSAPGARRRGRADG